MATIREVTFQHNWKLEWEIRTPTGPLPGPGAKDPKELNSAHLNTYMFVGSTTATQVCIIHYRSTAPKTTFSRMTVELKQPVPTNIITFTQVGFIAGLHNFLLCVLTTVYN